MKILIIDDEPLVRRSLRRALQQKNYEIIEAVDGTQGLELWKKEKPNLVFLDVLMPGLTGPQVLEEIGNEKTGKVIMMSAYSGENDLRQVLEKKVDLFLAKPFEDIFATVQKAEALL